MRATFRVYTAKAIYGVARFSQICNRNFGFTEEDASEFFPTSGMPEEEGKKNINPMPSGYKVLIDNNQTNMTYSRKNEKIVQQHLRTHIMELLSDATEFSYAAIMLPRFNQMKISNFWCEWYHEAPKFVTVGVVWLAVEGSKIDVLTVGATHSEGPSSFTVSLDH